MGSPHHSHATVEISVEVGVLASAVLMEVFSWSKRFGTSAKIWRPTWIRATVYFMDLTYGIINNSCLLLYIYYHSSNSNISSNCNSNSNSSGNNNNEK